MHDILPCPRRRRAGRRRACTSGASQSTRTRTRSRRSPRAPACWTPDFAPRRYARTPKLDSRFSALSIVPERLTEDASEPVFPRRHPFSCHRHCAAFSFSSSDSTQSEPSGRTLLVPSANHCLRGRSHCPGDPHSIPRSVYEQPRCSCEACLEASLHARVSRIGCWDSVGEKGGGGGLLGFPHANVAWLAYNHFPASLRCTGYR
jgi:hypothetical protein